MEPEKAPNKERWFSLSELAVTPSLPLAGVEAIVEHQPEAVILAAYCNNLELNPDLARKLLDAPMESFHTDQAEILIGAVASVFSPEELASEIAKRSPSWRVIAAAMTYLPQGVAMHYLTKFGAKSASVAQHAYLAGYTMPAANIRRLAEIEGWTPLIRFLALSCPEMRPEVRADQLMMPMDFDYAMYSVLKLVTADAIRTPEVTEVAASLAKTLLPDQLLHLRQPITGVAVTKNPDAASTLLKAVLGDSASFEFSEFMAVCMNYGLPTETRNWVRERASSLEHIRNPEFRVVPDSAVEYLGKVVAAQRPIEPAPDFEDHKVDNTLDHLVYDRRWPSLHRLVMRLADKHFGLADIMHVSTNLCEDLIPVFRNLLRSPISQEVVHTNIRRELRAAVTRLRRSGLEVDADTCWVPPPRFVSGVPAEIAEPVFNSLGVDSDAWWTFVGMVHNGLTLSEAAVVAC